MRHMGRIVSVCAGLGAAQMLSKWPRPSFKATRSQHARHWPCALLSVIYVSWVRPLCWCAIALRTQELNSGGLGELNSQLWLFRPPPKEGI